MYSWLNSDTWIIADTHLFHGRMVQYANRPKNHTWLIINNWRTLVHSTDNILHLGDVMFGNSQLMRRISFYLTGNKYVIKGNHDSRRKLRNLLGFTIVGEQVRYKAHTYWTLPVPEHNLIFSHRPLPLKYLEELDVLNIHGHIHNNPDVSSRHLNVCVEKTDYMPVRFGELLRRIK